MPRSPPARPRHPPLAPLVAAPASPWGRRARPRPALAPPEGSLPPTRARAPLSVRRRFAPVPASGDVGAASSAAPRNARRIGSAAPRESATRARYRLQHGRLGHVAADRAGAGTVRVGGAGLRVGSSVGWLAGEGGASPSRRGVGVPWIARSGDARASRARASGGASGGRRTLAPVDPSPRRPRGVDARLRQPAPVDVDVESSPLNTRRILGGRHVFFNARRTRGASGARPTGHWSDAGPVADSS